MSQRSMSVALALTLVVGVGIYAADRLVDPVTVADVSSVAEEVEPTGGTWVCPAGDGRDGTDLAMTIARPVTDTDVPGEVEVLTLEDGQRRLQTVPRLFSESSVTLGPDTGSGAATAVDWRDGPVVVHREWSLSAQDEEVPAGLVAGGCAQPFSDRWIVPGLVTSGGSQAVLRLANPFPSDATIAVSFVGPEGALQPLALRNLSVEGRGSLELDVNEFLPERPDLTAIVTVASGRIAAEGYQLERSAIGGVDGVSLLAAAGGSSEVWTVPWIVDGENLASWLWVFNPGDRQAPVELTYHTPDGGIVPEGLTEVIVEPGQLRRIDLRGTLPEDTNVVAVTARSEGAPVVVSAAARLTSPNVERTGFAVQLGVPRSDRSWTVSGGSTEGRTEQLHLINPGSEEAMVSVALFAGASLQRPEDWQDMAVPAGARRVIELSDELGSVGSWTAFVVARSGEVVVGRVGSDDQGARRLVASAGVASSTWRASGSGLTATRTDGLVQRFATSLGIARADRIPRSSPEPLPEPVPPPDADIDSDLGEPLDDLFDEPFDADLGAQSEAPGEGPTDDDANETADIPADRLDQDLFGAPEAETSDAEQDAGERDDDTGDGDAAEGSEDADGQSAGQDG